MTSDTAWIEEARRMRAEGRSVMEIVAAFGRSEYFVRRALNINGLNDRLEKANAEKRTGPSKKHVVSGKRSRAGQSAKTYIDPPAPKVITLAKLSFLAKPVEEPKPTFRLAPKTHCRVEQPGVARWRDKHRELIRAGKVSAPDQEMQS